MLVEAEVLDRAGSELEVALLAVALYIRFACTEVILTLVVLSLGLAGRTGGNEHLLTRE